MANYYNRRCSPCGQFITAQDRETLLDEYRHEWDEATVDDFLAANLHVCIDPDPHGAKLWNRLADEGIMRPQLDWLIGIELDRRRATAATVPAYRRIAARRTMAATITAAPIVALALDAGRRTARLAARPLVARAGPSGPLDSCSALLYSYRMLPAERRE